MSVVADQSNERERMLGVLERISKKIATAIYDCSMVAIRVNETIPMKRNH